MLIYSSNRNIFWIVEREREKLLKALGTRPNVPLGQDVPMSELQLILSIVKN